MLEKLKSYGLDKYEALTYLTLLKIGMSTSSVISKKSKVPYGKIYPVLYSLESEGFVKVYSGRPKKFVATEPRIVLNTIMDKKSKELKNLKKENNNLIKELEIRSKEDFKKPLEKIKIIEGKKNTLNLAVKLHERAKKEWKTINRLPIYYPHLKSYKQARKRGIKIKVLTKITPENKNNVKIWKKFGADVRVLKEIPSRFTVIDEDYAVLRLSDPKVGGYLSLHVENPNLAKTLSSYFDGLWKKGKKI